MMKYTHQEKEGAQDHWIFESGKQNRSSYRKYKEIKDKRLIQLGDLAEVSSLILLAT